MRIVSVDISNFLSIEQAHVDFDDNGLLLIEGWNYDVDRANGAGKTAILNAISFALYDKLPRRITASEMLRRGAKKGHVSIRVDCGSEILEVRRSRPKGVKFYLDANGALDELNITQDEWERKLGLSYNQFIVSMYCSQGNSSVSPRFLLLNDTDKKEFLLQLLNLDEFTLCKRKTDEKISTIIHDTTQLQNQLAILQSRIDAYSEGLLDEGHARMVLDQKETARQTFVRALNDAVSIAKPDFAKYAQLEEDIFTKRTIFAQLHTEREGLAREWSKLARSMKPFDAVDACPTCGTELDNSHSQRVHEEEMRKLKSDQVSVKQQMDALDINLLDEQKLIDLQLKLKERKKKESAEYEKAQIAQRELNSSVQLIESQIANLTKSLSDNVLLNDRIQKLNGEKDELEGQLSSLRKDLEVQKTVSNIFSPTGAQAYVLDSAVSLFNEHISKHINQLWSNLTYELQSYKETVRGDVTAKFSESIIMDGKPISLGSLSGGELKALSICADMALLGILEQQFGIHMSPIIFDEAFDGLDTSGKEFAIDLIRQLGQDRQVIVIDHASEMRATFDKILTVEKRNGISSVSVNT